MDTFTDYESFDGLGLASLIQSHVISPHELLTAAIERIEAYNPKLNAVIFKMYDAACQQIESSHPDGIFHGVPFLLKDLFADFAGAPMHFGSRFANGYTSFYDGELVKRFKKAGLIILGKTNTPEFGLSPTTEPELFGPTLNPWDRTRSPGGSSGGSAAAVASRMVPMAHGGDGAGSLRIPAAYCGVFALKPSRGRTPQGSNLMRIWQNMVVENAITRTVRDSAAMLDVLSGPELGSPFSMPKPEESFLESLQQPLRPLRIAISTEPFFKADLNSEYREAFNKTAKLCQDLGHTMESKSFSIDSDEVALANLIVVAAETAASLKLLDQVLSHVDKQSLETLTAILCEIGEHFNAKDFAWASHILDTVTKQSAEFFEKYDMLLTPTMAIPPPLLGGFKPYGLEKNILEFLRRIPYGPLLRKITQRSSSKYFGFIPYTPIFNITGQPAMSVPLFWDRAGLPIGMQFAAGMGQEKILLQLAKQLEDACPWAHRKPELS
jgi:amidase